MLRVKKISNSWEDSFRRTLTVGVYLLFILSGCDCNRPQPNVETPPQKIKTVVVPKFNEDSAYAFTKRQIDFGPRIPGTKEQAACAKWLANKLKDYTPDVIIQDVQVKIYNGKMVPCINMIASFNPDVQKRVLLFAHWDTRPWSDRDETKQKEKFDGADDAAGSVGTLIEIARQLSKQECSVGVDILLVDVEDYGPPEFEGAKWNEKDTYALGTQYWARHPHKPNYRAYYGILLDMSSAKGARFLKEGISMQYAPSIVNKIWNTAAALGYGNYFVNEQAIAIVDDHSYVNQINGTPSIDIIWLDKNSQTGFAPHWHTQQDNMNVIDKNTMKAVGQTLLQVVYNEPKN